MFTLSYGDMALNQSAFRIHKCYIIQPVNCRWSPYLLANFRKISLYLWPRFMVSKQNEAGSNNLKSITTSSLKHLLVGIVALVTSESQDFNPYYLRFYALKRNTNATTRFSVKNSINLASVHWHTYYIGHI